MNKFAFVSLLPLTLCISCYPMLCDDLIATDSSNCIEFQEDHYSIRPCSYSNYTCPHPSHITTSYDLPCEFWVDKAIWDAESTQDYYGYSEVSDGDPCDPYGLVSVCKRNDDLVCYCPLEICSCTTGLKYGENCISDSTPCIAGHICSNKICTLKYSVEEGGRATDEQACIAGGPLVIGNGFFSCKSLTKTFGTLPKECLTNNDCVTEDGSTFTECKCGMNEDSKAYCELHYGDEPMIKWREATRDGDYPREMYWKFLSVNWVYLQGNIPSCLGTT